MSTTFGWTWFSFSCWPNKCFKTMSGHENSISLKSVVCMKKCILLKVILKRDGKAEEKWSKETPFMWACTQYTEFLKNSGIIISVPLRTCEVTNGYRSW